MAPAASVSGDVINYKAQAGDIGDFLGGGGGGGYHYRKVKISTNSKHLKRLDEETEKPLEEENQHIYYKKLNL